MRPAALEIFATIFATIVREGFSGEVLLFPLHSTNNSFFVFSSNLISWIEMGCVIAGFDRRELKT